MELTPQQEKALRIMNNVFDLAQSISNIHSKKIPNVELLSKRIFPKRNIPHILKKRRKEEAKRLVYNRTVLTAASMALGVTQTAISLSAPLPNYESGGLMQA